MDIDYQIVRSKKRTRSTSLHIDDDGQVIVRAPHFAPESMIHHFVTQHTDWIQDRLKTHAQESKVKKKFITGELFPYQGQLYPLSITESPTRTRTKINLIDDMLIMLTPKIPDRHRLADLRDALKKWYISQSRPIFESQSTHYANLIGTSYQTIRIKETSSRWGSCSSHGNLNYNWKLILAPQEILTYVVIHEVCHLVHAHHQASFWDLVRKYDPAYPQHRRWLQKNGWKLNI